MNPSPPRATITSASLRRMGAVNPPRAAPWRLLRQRAVGCEKRDVACRGHGRPSSCRCPHPCARGSETQSFIRAARAAFRGHRAAFHPSPTPSHPVNRALTDPMQATTKGRRCHECPPPRRRFLHRKASRPAMPRSSARSARSWAASADEDRADRLGKHRLCRRDGGAGLGDDQQICRGLPRSALLRRLPVCRHRRGTGDRAGQGAVRRGLRERPAQLRLSGQPRASSPRCSHRATRFSA